MTTINSKMGLRPAGKRKATDSSAKATGVLCVTCRSSYVLRTQSQNGRLAGDYMCCACGAFFWDADVLASARR